MSSTAASRRRAARWLAATGFGCLLVAAVATVGLATDALPLDAGVDAGVDGEFVGELVGELVGEVDRTVVIADAPVTLPADGPAAPGDAIESIDADAIESIDASAMVEPIVVDESAGSAAVARLDPLDAAARMAVSRSASSLPWLPSLPAGMWSSLRSDPDRTVTGPDDDAGSPWPSWATCAFDDGRSDAPGIRSVVVDRDRQRSWFCDGTEVARVFPITSARNQPDPGVYEVYAKDLQAWSTFGGGNSTMTHFVAFTHGKFQGARVAFHSVPIGGDGEWVQPLESVGSPDRFGDSSGCIRALPADAEAIWDWLEIGDLVRVVT